ncbi:MAG: hypothetical protein SWY16_04385 [Cyanobacteriota bacterium]|nr:hypothetical protein [Cyanobacteriota bacterium]
MSITVTYPIVLFIGYIWIGWLLAAFEMPWFVWLGTSMVTLHLSVAGTRAIFLANTWLVGLIAVGALGKCWPAIWDETVPKKDGALWATGLLGIWVSAIILIVMLAFAPQPLHSLGFASRKIQRGISIGLTWIAIGAGSFLYFQPG